MIDITGLSKGSVIAALHNGTRPLGLGVFSARGDMTAAEGQALVDERLEITAGDSFDPRLYDRDAGRPTRRSRSPCARTAASPSAARRAASSRLRRRLTCRTPARLSPDAVAGLRAVGGGL